VGKEPHNRAQQLLFQIAIFAGVDLGTRMIQAAVGKLATRRTPSAFASVVLV
jgi:hypothetical protein